MGNSRRKVLKTAGLAAAIIFSDLIVRWSGGGQVRAASKSGEYVPVSQITGEESEYIPIYAEESEYTVQEGDCLWTIAQAHYGDGSRSYEIAAHNKIADPDFIYPGQELSLLGKKLYIPKQEGSLGGLEYGVFQFDVPKEWAFGTTGLDTELGAFYPRSEETVVTFNVSRNNFGRNGFSADLEEFYKSLNGRKEEVLGEIADRLHFETYTLENGDALYFYSFELEDGDGKIWTEAVGYRLCENLKAEFIGIGPNAEGYPVEDLVRYITADFKEDASEGIGEDFSIWSGAGADYMGEDSWDYEGFHNAFAVGYKAVTGKAWKSPAQQAALNHISEAEDYAVTWEEPILECGVRRFLGKDMEEPVYASELEEITVLGLVEWYPDDMLYVNDDTYSCSFAEIWQEFEDRPLPDDFGEAVIRDMQHFVNLDTVLLQISDLESYSGLGELTGLKSLILSRDIEDRETQIKDISFLGNLKELEELTLAKAFEGISDWSVLKECPNLKYVDLETGEGCDFSFLDYVENLVVNGKKY